MNLFTLAASVMWVWGTPIEGALPGDTGTVYQVFMCKSMVHVERGIVGKDCLVYGQALPRYTDCQQALAAVKDDLPEYGERTCMTARDRDLRRLTIPK